MIFKIFSKKTPIDESLLESLEEDLISSDFGMVVSQNIINKLRKVKMGAEVSYEELQQIILKIISDDITPYFNNNDLIENIKKNENRPFVIMFCGVNGVGKTTSIAKITKLLGASKFKTLLVPADTFRAGAHEQLKLWSEKLDQYCEFFSRPEIKQPAALVYQGIEYAKNKGIDVVLIDTAGRFDNNSTLMDELSKIESTAKKVMSTSPHCNILVLDGTSGQIATSQAKNFAAAVDINGIFITKLDSTAKGGFMINIIKSLHCPVYFIGNGEKEDDISKFDLSTYLKNIFK